MTLRLSDSLLIGFAAGLVSTYGFARIQAVLEESCGIHDTCGIHNLHAMPSLIGGLASVILAAYKGPMGHDVPDVMSYQDQWWRQLAAIAMTLALSITSGLFTGVVLRYLRSTTIAGEVYSDGPHWELMDDFGRSFEDNLKARMDNLDQGVIASNRLRSIVARFAALGVDLSGHGKQSWMDFSKHSGSRHSVSSSHQQALGGEESQSGAMPLSALSAEMSTVPLEQAPTMD